MRRTGEIKESIGQITAVFTSSYKIHHIHSVFIHPRIHALNERKPDHFILLSLQITAVYDGKNTPKNLARFSVHYKTSRRYIHTEMYSNRHFGVVSPLDSGKVTEHTEVNSHGHEVNARYQTVLLTLMWAKISDLPMHVSVFTIKVQVIRLSSGGQDCKTCKIIWPPTWILLCMWDIIYNLYFNQLNFCIQLAI